MRDDRLRRLPVGGILLGLALVARCGARPRRRAGLGLAMGFALLAVGLLSSGGYGLVERTTAGLVGLFTLFTVAATVVVQDGRAITARTSRGGSRRRSHPTGS